MQICQALLSIQKPQVPARDEGSCKKEVEFGASQAVELNYRGLPFPGAHLAQKVGVPFLPQPVLVC